MIISLCIPNMNRTHDLKKVLPSIVESANESPPVEIVIVNYSSRDDLETYIAEAQSMMPLSEGNFWTYAKLDGKQYYNSAHARNLCVVASKGEYIVQLATDIMPSKQFVARVRVILEAERPVWMCEGEGIIGHTRVPWMGRLLICLRDEFMAAGGYDERFKFYAPEDKDICSRLYRRGGKFWKLPESLVTEIATPYRDKLRNLDLRPFANDTQKKLAMARLMHPIYEENNRLGVLVANPNGWGLWE